MSWRSAPPRPRTASWRRRATTRTCRTSTPAGQGRQLDLRRYAGSMSRLHQCHGVNDARSPTISLARPTRVRLGIILPATDSTARRLRNHRHPPRTDRTGALPTSRTQRPPVLRCRLVHVQASDGCSLEPRDLDDHGSDIVSVGCRARRRGAVRRRQQHRYRWLPLELHARGVRRWRDPDRGRAVR